MKIKNMKNAYSIAAVLCLALGLTACSPKAEETAPVETTAAETSSRQEGTEESKKETTEEETTTEAETEAERMIVTGRVEAIDKTVVTLNGQDGQRYQVDLKDAETKSDLEIGEGDEIQVTFVDSCKEVKEPEAYTIISSVALEGDMDPVIAGLIAEAGEGTITIETDSGSTYTFSTTIAQVVTGSGGIAAGGYVEITYLGTPDEGVALRVITEEGSGKADATYNLLEGTLVSYTDSSITIQAANGSPFTFALDGYVDMEELGLGAGDDVEITYEGSLTQQNAVAIDVG